MVLNRGCGLVRHAFSSFDPRAEELRLEGFSVIEAYRADDALTYIKAGAQVDLVFSDIQTPCSLNGLQLAETLRDKYPDIPVILTSGNALPGHVGIVEAFVPKPYDVTQTIALMSAILAQKSLGDPYERSLHLDCRAGLARENAARGVSSRGYLVR
jgi:CheY-like chemotaxis protein